MRKLTERRILKWCEANLKSEEEKERERIIHSKTEKEYLGIKYFLYDMENAGGSRWISLELDSTQFQGWELDLINALKDHFDLPESFLRNNSRDYQDHKSIEGQKEFLDEVAVMNIDWLYNRCINRSELINDKIEYFNQVLKWLGKFNTKIASHERLRICPKCRNKTLLISDKEEFNMCINIKCCYSESKENYLDAVGYNWEKE